MLVGLSGHAGLEPASALQLVEAAVAADERANAGRPWLPHDSTALAQLWHNSDLSVLDFLDTGKIGSDARAKLDPPKQRKLRELSLACIVLHMLRHSLAKDSPPDQLRALLPPLLEGGGSALAAVRKAAEASAGADWGAVLAQLPADEADCAAEGAVAAALLEVSTVLRGFADMSPEDLTVPASAMSLLATLPLHVASTLLADVEAGGAKPAMLERAGGLVRWLAVVPALMTLTFAGLLPSPKAKKSRHENSASSPARNKFLGSNNAHHCPQPSHCERGSTARCLAWLLLPRGCWIRLPSSARSAFCHHSPSLFGGVPLRRRAFAGAGCAAKGGGSAAGRPIAGWCR